MGLMGVMLAQELAHPVWCNRHTCRLCGSASQQAGNKLCCCNVRIFICVLVGL